MFVLNKSRCQYLTESCSSRSSYPTGVVFNAGQERPTWALYIQLVLAINGKLKMNCAKVDEVSDVTLDILITSSEI